MKINKKKFFKRMVSLVFIVVFGFVAYYAYSFYDFYQTITAIEEDVTGNEQNNDKEETYIPPEWEGKERVNILLLGGDNRNETQAARTDTMIVASIDPVTNEIILMSVLRDAYIPIPGYGSNRANAAYTLGGAELSMKAISEWLDIPIQYYASVDFETFVGLVDALGGIEYEIEKNMMYDVNYDGKYNHPEDIYLTAGVQELDGQKALQYVRYRGDIGSDYTRTERQRKLLSAIMKEMQSVSSIFKIPDILNGTKDYIRTNLSATDMLKLGSLALELNTSEIKSVQLPPLELLNETTIGGASVITVSPTAIKDFVQEQFEPPVPEQTEDDMQNDEQEGNTTE
ncbi:LCP family protein [Longirhabdus pacifica]|uniref:LCP family protein n=1 Tax=Longirhabdus pacifica TaxID=2305227 RepID=UPI001008F7BF|nr:LCP family protein [Longirhabdus pacifica]